MEQVILCPTLLLAVDGVGVWMLHGGATRAAAGVSPKTLVLSTCGPSRIRALFWLITCHLAAIRDMRITANHRPGVDAGWSVLFAFQSSRPRAAQAGR